MGKTKQNKKEKKHPHKRTFTNNLQAHIWVSIVFITLVVIVGFYVAVSWLFPIQYTMYRESEIISVGDRFVSQISGSNPTEYRDLDTESRYISTYYEGTVHVFSVSYTIEGDSVDITEYTGYVFYDYQSPIDESLEIDKETLSIFLSNIGLEKPDTYIDHDNESVIYGACIDSDNMQNPDKHYFLYISISSSIGPFILEITSNVFILIAIISLMLSFLSSGLVAIILADPIDKLSVSVSKVAKGDYSVQFTGKGIYEIELLANNLQEVTGEISKTENLRREFLANVSHDLRTPLTMVKAYAEMIRDLSGNNKTKRTAHTQIIIDEADRLTALVEQISDLSKINSGVIDLELRNVNLSAVARMIAERFSGYIEREGYKIELDLVNSAMVRVDAIRIEQVLYNLISNALNYSGKSKTIKVAIKKDEKAERYIFSVTDNGKGIAKDEIDKIWDRYYRANVRKRSTLGSGLGLSIVKGILDTHEGAKLGIESTVGKGSTFWFSLPTKNSLIDKEETETQKDGK